MKTETNPNCQCPKTKCPNHGNCVECKRAHTGKSFCTANGVKKAIAKLLAKGGRT